MIRTDLYAAVLFFPALILLICVWWKKLNGIGKLVFYILLIGISVGIFLLQLFTLMEASMRETAIILIATAFFLVVNLYWARLWIMRPYLIRNSE
jgi:hypothetical protein